MSIHPPWQVYLPRSDITITLRTCCLAAAQQFIEEQDLDGQLVDLDGGRQASYDEGYNTGVDVGERNLEEAKRAIRKAHEITRGW